jgi:hypothetical protein
MAKLPPLPTGVPPGHSFWNDWYEKLRTLVNNSGIAVLWTNIDFTGSNLTNIVTRNHSDTQGLQGGTSGQYYHLTSAQHTALGNIGLLPMTSQAADPTASDIAASTAKLYKNTTSGTVKLWVNDGGVLKSVTLS